MAAKLKNLKITKVDFVDDGANPEAHIKLYKSKEGNDTRKKQDFWQQLFRMIEKAAKTEKEKIEDEVDPIQKSGATNFETTFSEVKNRKIADEIWDICYALQSALCSILNDTELDKKSASHAMEESLNEFSEVVTEAIKQWSEGRKSGIEKKETEVTKAELEQMKMAKARLENNIATAVIVEKTNPITEWKGVTEMKIDKSKLTPAERAFLESIEKRYGTEETVEETPTSSETTESLITKSTTKEINSIVTEPKTEDIYQGLHPAVKAELENLKKFREDAQDRELHQIAKKYTLLGKKEEELFPVLKSLKAENETAYQDMIAVLDQSLETIEKSGIFSEIGKSGHGSMAGSAWAEAEKKAVELMKSKQGLSKAQALDEVLLANPELRERCEKED